MRTRNCSLWIFVVSAAAVITATAVVGSRQGKNVSASLFDGRTQHRLAMLEAEVRHLTDSVMLSQQQPAYGDLLAVSVKVDVGGACGSGVLVTRQLGDETHTYVWTAGHVVEGLRKKDGTFGEATICQEKRQSGFYCGSRQAKAKVIAYSDPTYGEDLALLEVLQSNFCPLRTSAQVALRSAPFPVGTELVHVGCTLGIYGSVSRGIVSQTDRNLLENGKTFDQTTVMGYPGSSGGGVYLASSGECIGLLVRGAGPGLNFIVSVRRMLPWARRMGIEWALNPNCPMPSHVVRDATPLTDGSESRAPVLDLDVIRDIVDQITGLRPRYFGQ